MADTYHTEAGRSLRALGFHTDHIPDGEKNKESIQFGRADFVYMRRNRGGAWEVKTGRGQHRQHWPFAEWNDKQRLWAERWTNAGNSYFLFITVGTRIQSKPTEKVPYPRITVLLPRDEVLRLEAASDRKSLSYEQIDGMTAYRLEWAGEETWTIPPQHPFWAAIKGKHLWTKHRCPRLRATSN